MTFYTAQAFLFDHVGLGMLQHGPNAYCMTASVNSSAADLSVGLLWESLENGVAALLKLCHVASATPQRNPTHKRVLKASIRGSKRLSWDDCTYYGDSLNQQICKLQIPHQTMAICGNAVDQCSSKSPWILLNILQWVLCTYFLAHTHTHSLLLFSPYSA